MIWVLYIDAIKDASKMAAIDQKIPVQGCFAHLFSYYSKLYSSVWINKVLYSEGMYSNDLSMHLLSCFRSFTLNERTKIPIRLK